jgi:hypothetical protein
MRGGRSRPPDGAFAMGATSRTRARRLLARCSTLPGSDKPPQWRDARVLACHGRSLARGSNAAPAAILPAAPAGRPSLLPLANRAVCGLRISSGTSFALRQIVNESLRVWTREDSAREWVNLSRYRLSVCKSRSRACFISGAGDSILRRARERAMPL